jgi:hypothetical protein
MLPIRMFWEAHSQGPFPGPRGDGACRANGACPLLLEPVVAWPADLSELSILKQAS